jgi:hypothetical protein
MAGAKIYNLQESLVSVRMGNEQQMRRGILKTTFIKAFGNIRTTKPTDTFLIISKRLKNPIL